MSFKQKHPHEYIRALCNSLDAYELKKRAEKKGFDITEEDILSLQRDKNRLIEFHRSLDAYVDYRILCRNYINHVIQNEGLHYLGVFPPFFTYHKINDEPYTSIRDMDHDLTMLQSTHLNFLMQDLLNKPIRQRRHSM